MPANPLHRLCLWSGPRNISTALMYAFAQRADTYVVDEPLYGHYLRVSGAPHPGADAIMAAMDCDAARVIETVILGPCDRPLLFHKSMAHHLVEVDWRFLEQTTNILLTRDPLEMLPSLSKVLNQPRLEDTGLKKQVDLLHYLQALGQDVPVLEARELLLNPEQVLKRLCKRLDLSFDRTMLRWPAGPIYADGIWAPYWYENIHKSTGFQPYRPKTEPFPERLRPLLEECQPCYRQLWEIAIKAG